MWEVKGLEQRCWESLTVTGRNACAAGGSEPVGNCPKLGVWKRRSERAMLWGPCSPALCSGLGPLLADGAWNQQVSHQQRLPRVMASASFPSFRMSQKFLSWPSLTWGHAGDWFPSLRPEWWCQVENIWHAPPLCHRGIHTHFPSLYLNLKEEQNHTLTQQEATIPHLPICRGCSFLSYLSHN